MTLCRKHGKKKYNEDIMPDSSNPNIDLNVQDHFQKAKDTLKYLLNQMRLGFFYDKIIVRYKEASLVNVIKLLLRCK